MSQFLVIEIIDHTVSKVKPFDDEHEAIAFAREVAADLGYTDGCEKSEDHCRFNADWWAPGDPGNNICVFDTHSQCGVPQGDLL